MASSAVMPVVSMVSRVGGRFEGCVGALGIPPVACLDVLLNAGEIALRAPISRARRRAPLGGARGHEELCTRRVGKTTVPMSRPSMTMPPASPSRRCRSTKRMRTSGSAATREAHSPASGVRSASVTSRPSRTTRCPAGSGRSAKSSRRSASPARRHRRDRCRARAPPGRRRDTWRRCRRRCSRARPRAGARACSSLPPPDRRSRRSRVVPSRSCAGRFRERGVEPGNGHLRALGSSITTADRPARPATAAAIAMR